MAPIRLFIALALSTEAREVLRAVVELAQAQIAPGVVRWVKADQMHLTLRFLGDTPQQKLQALAEVMDRAAAAQRPFGLELDRLGCFPHERQPRVIWAGVRGEVAQAAALHKSLEVALQELGWPPESRAFQPHITIGRVKERGARIALPWGRGVAAAQIKVREMILFESRWSAAGPTYIRRHVSLFGGARPLGNGEA